MREARRLPQSAATGLIAALTAAYGAGQIIGPALVDRALQHSETPSQSFALALTIAMASLVIGTVILLAIAWMHPAANPNAATR